AAGGNEDVPILDPESGLEANTKKDFQVFINLVDLIRDVLCNVDSKLFHTWTQPFMCHIITESSHKPLVSGFYKLLTVTLELCDKNSYFTGTEGVESQPKEHRMLYTLVCSFLRELLVKLMQYKNDLEVACLETILATPVALVVPLIPHAAPAFTAVFRVGRSMLKVARLGLSALDKWTRELPPNIMKPLLVEVLPHLDPFLRSKGLGGSDDVIEMQLMLLGRRRRGVSSTRIKKKMIVERADSELLCVQKQIISLLGQLDCSTCLALLQDPHSQDIWGPSLSEPLHFALPFKDMKLKLRLVVDIALTSSDRATRFTACELLHSLVMLLLGLVVNRLNFGLNSPSVLAIPCLLFHNFLLFSKLACLGKELQNVQPDMYSKVLKKLCLPLLKLGCDPDQAVRSLYHLLVLQLAHWYSSKFMIRSKQTAIFIDTVMADTKRRKPPEFEGVTLKHALTWLYTSVEQLKQNADISVSKWWTH
ncbi:hypothetical protein L9F63_015223, partial [Diploptera punctata]